MAAIGLAIEARLPIANSRLSTGTKCSRLAIAVCGLPEGHPRLRDLPIEKVEQLLKHNCNYGNLYLQTHLSQLR